MPRMMLTEQEAALIEKVRAKTAIDQAWNDALDAARGLVRETLTDHSILGSAAASLLEEKLQDLRRSIRLVP